ncbi:cation efflux system protein CusF precursor [mine drainage metagenome]|uniref:Cation efflux system protein CusF n=1 Tax=mine drainage metagenome TaxID=410659 RepID=A0A1J5RHC8_9ZZZZ
MKRLMIVLTCAALVAAAMPSYAGDAHSAKTEAQQSYAVKGEVVELDQAVGKVKLKHQAVPELGWPGMTMFFPVADKAQLARLKVGDRVAFRFVMTHDGGPLITRIESAK